MSVFSLFDFFVSVRFFLSECWTIVSYAEQDI